MKRTKFTRLAGSLIWLPFMCLPLMGQIVVRNEVQAFRPPDGTRPAKAEIREPGEPAASGGLQLRADVRAWPDSTVTFTAAGERQSKTAYTYDAAGHRTLSEFFKREANRWVNSSKWVYGYDAAGNTTLEESYNWGNNRWTESSKYVYEYDAAGHQTLYESYIWENNQWTGRYKYTYVYDGRGVQILWGLYKWMDNQWVKTRETHYERKNVNSKVYVNVSVFYDEDGSRTGLFIEGSDLSWASTLSEEYKMEYNVTYDANDHLTLVETTFLIDGKRVPFQRYVLKYSNNNLISIEIYDYIRNDIGQMSRKATSTYDVNGNRTLSESYWWNWESEKWIGHDRLVGTYDANGNQLSDEIYIWNTSSGGWVGSWNNVYTYDANGNVLSNEYYSWDTSSSSWIVNGKDIYAYDANGNQLSYEEYTWNTSSGSWTGSSKTTYEKRNDYGDVILRYDYSWKDGGWEWTTYTVTYPGGSDPNATEHIGDAEPLVYAHGGSLHIRTVRAERTDIYTLDGARVYGRQVPAGTTTLPLPPGMYIVKVGNRTEKIAIGK
jgi:hypothetical protein